MKKQLIAAAIAAAVAAPAAMAGAPTVYGQFNLSIDTESKTYNSGATAVKTGGSSVNSNGSRVGIKGAEDLGNGLKALYQLEWQVDIAGGKKAGATETLSARNAYVGLAGGFGAFLLGRHDTPTKVAQPTDTFNDGAGDNKPMAGGLGFGGAGAEIRAANVLAWVSPSFNGVKLIVAGVSPEQDTAGTRITPSLGDAVSAAIMYGSKKEGLYLSAGYDTFDKKIVNGATASFTQYRLAAQYTYGPLMGNIMYASYDDGVSGNTNNQEGNNVQVNVAYTVGAATLKAKYSNIDYKPSGAKDGSAWGIGMDYALGKKTTGYVEYVSFDKNTRDTGGALAYKSDGTTLTERSVLSIGLVHKF